MNKEIIKLEFPFKLEELLNYTFNFDNLIKAIAFLHNNNIKLVNEIKIQSKNIQNQNEALNKSIKNIQEQMLKNDLSINDMKKKLSEQESKFLEYDKIIQIHDKNLSHLNKVVEDNVKKIDNIDKETSANKTQILNINENIQKLKDKDNDLENLIQSKTELLNSRIDENKGNIENLDNSVATLNSLFNVLKNKMDTKNKEFENMIKNITGGIGGKIIDLKNSDYKDDASGENAGLLIKTINDNHFLNSKIGEMEEEIKKFKEIMDAKEEKLKELVDKNKNDIDDIKNNMEQMTQQIETIIKEAAEEKDDPLKNLDLSKYVTKDVFKKASDNIRILTSAINTTTTRDEFEKEIKKINVRLQAVELLQQGVSYGPRTMINSNLVQSGAEPQELYITNSHNPNEIIQLKEIMKFQNSEEIKNINILKNPKFSDILNSIAKLEKDIGKNDSSIINIRNILALTPTQNDVINLRQEVERISEESSKKINEIVKTINGEEEDEEEDDKKNALAGYCLNKKINILITRFNEIYSKLISIQNKNNAFSREIKEEVKQNLKTETIKVVEEFKSKLNSFTNKFDNELRMKIDHGGLSVFEDKISNKFRTDLKEKLDKTELKKNNYVIKRKINNLENKISKTLVDTIIDLQMDEAPLIIKTNSQNVELCASCNQILKKNFLNTDRNFYRNTELNSTIGNKKIFKSNSNQHSNLNLNTKEINAKIKKKKLPGILSYTQSK